MSRLKSLHLRCGHVVLVPKYQSSNPDDYPEASRCEPASAASNRIDLHPAATQRAQGWKAGREKKP